MSRSAIDRARQASEAIDAFLQGRAVSRSGLSPLAEIPTASGVTPGRMPPASARQLGRQATSPHGADACFRLPTTDWLRHRLTIAGSPAALEAFRAAASGAGTIPWRLDLDSLEEDWFHRLVDPARRELSLAGARILATQLRQAVEHRHSLAVARVGHSRACALDLHSLLPVPPDILHLGPDHPDALYWLWTHWGTPAPLRQVAADRDPPARDRPRPSAGEPELRLVFWSADWTPWPAFRRIAAVWPALRFTVRPEYGQE